ncbi:dienelactone hydrolase, partial [Pseudomonas sp. FW305-47B]|uniref:dienelactone hydrolase family protein n=1 Tax=Pseudomonas sp. FW305-47B TaxID=2070558 RepID=UPI000CC3FED7
VLQGFLAYDGAGKKDRPGILVFHQWTGLSEYEKGRAIQLAKLGYMAFAADIYGKGIHAKDMKEAGELATKYKSNRSLLRDRAKA